MKKKKKNLGRFPFYPKLENSRARAAVADNFLLFFPSVSKFQSYLKKKKKRRNRKSKILGALLEASGQKKLRRRRKYITEEEPLCTRLPEAPAAYAVEGDESVSEERLHHHGEVFPLQVPGPIGQPGDAALWRGESFLNPPGRAGRTSSRPAASGWR